MKAASAIACVALIVLSGCQSFMTGGLIGVVAQEINGSPGVSAQSMKPETDHVLTPEYLRGTWRCMQNGMMADGFTSSIYKSTVRFSQDGGEVSNAVHLVESIRPDMEGKLNLSYAPYTLKWSASPGVVVSMHEKPEILNFSSTIPSMQRAAVDRLLEAEAGVPQKYIIMEKHRNAFSLKAKDGLVYTYTKF